MRRAALSAALLLAVPAAALSAQSCPGPDLSVPPAGATSVEVRHADVPNARFPGVWQQGRLGNLSYRLYPGGYGAIGPGPHMADWRIEMSCNPRDRTCTYWRFGAVPEGMQPRARQLGRCLLGPEPQTAQPAAAAGKQAPPAAGAGPAASPAPAAPKALTREPAPVAPDAPAGPRAAAREAAASSATAAPARPDPEAAAPSAGPRTLTREPAPAAPDAPTGPRAAARGTPAPQAPAHPAPVAREPAPVAPHRAAPRAEPKTPAPASRDGAPPLGEPRPFLCWTVPQVGETGTPAGSEVLVCRPAPASQVPAEPAPAATTAAPEAGDPDLAPAPAQPAPERGTPPSPAGPQRPARPAPLSGAGPDAPPGPSAGPAGSPAPATQARVEAATAAPEAGDPDLAPAPAQPAPESGTRARPAGPQPVPWSAAGPAGSPAPAAGGTEARGEPGPAPGKGDAPAPEGPRHPGLDARPVSRAAGAAPAVPRAAPERVNLLPPSRPRRDGDPRPAALPRAAATVRPAAAVVPRVPPSRPFPPPQPVSQPVSQPIPQTAAAPRLALTRCALGSAAALGREEIGRIGQVSVNLNCSGRFGDRLTFSGGLTARPGGGGGDGGLSYSYALNWRITDTVTLTYANYAAALAGGRGLAGLGEGRLQLSAPLARIPLGSPGMPGRALACTGFASIARSAPANGGVNCGVNVTERLAVRLTVLAWPPGAQREGDADFSYSASYALSDRVTLTYSNYANNRWPWNRSPGQVELFHGGTLGLSYRRDF